MNDAVDLALTGFQRFVDRSGEVMAQPAVMGIQMKQNRIFDQNSSQKARSWHYNMDTNRAEAQFADGSAIAIDCLAIEDEYGNTPAQRAELDWLLYNKPLECVQLVLSGEIEHYLSLGCDHGKLKD